MNAVNVAQGTPEWKAARAGKVTASHISDVMAKIKSGEAATRRNYKAQLVAETLLKAPLEDDYTNAAMDWGTEQEPFARVAYEISRDAIVEQVGFVIHPQIERSGASPDGLVGEDGVVEIKCPKTATHLQYILAGQPPAEHQLQMLWQMACCERRYCDFVSFDPRLPEHLQLFVVRYSRDDKRIAEVTAEVKRLLSEVDDILARLPKANETALERQLEDTLNGLGISEEDTKIVTG